MTCLPYISDAFESLKLCVFGLNPAVWKLFSK
jgi:hypothetical protein